MSSKTQRQRRRRRRRWLMRKLTLIIFNTISHTLHIQYHPHHALGIWQWATFCGCVSVSAMQLCALSRSEENSNYIWLLAFVSLLIKVIRMNLSGFHQRDGRKRRTNSQQCWWIFSIHRTRSHQRFFFFSHPSVASSCFYVNFNGSRMDSSAGRKFLAFFIGEIFKCQPRQPVYGNSNNE